MNLQAHDFDALDAYWRGNLPDTQRQDLENRLKREPEFKQAAQQFQLTVYALRAAQEREAYDYLTHLRQSLPAVTVGAPALQPSFVARHRTALMALAAAFVGILVVWVNYRPNASPLDATSGVHDYFAQGEGLRRASSNDLLYAQAIQDAAQGRYEEAIPIFKAQYESFQDTSALFQLGMAQLGAKHLDSAIESLEKCSKHPELNIKASFYLALALMEKDPKDARARQLLQMIANTSGDYGGLAKEIMVNAKW